jgi:hypothetical protein
MRPRTIGRALGIGVRVAGRIAGQRVAASAQSAASAPNAQAVPAGSATVSTVPAAQAVAQVAGHAARGAGQGVAGFLRPIRRVGGIVWLEVTGVFFLLPVIVFAPTLWRAALGYSHSTDHKTLWSSAVVVAVFLYLSLSSFWRARRR